MNQFISDLFAKLSSLDSNYLAIIGTLFGVGLGQFIAYRTHISGLKMQFNHEHSVKRSDRDYDIKKTHYLECIEVLTSGLMMIPRFSDLSIPTESVLQPYNEKVASVAKAASIASVEVYEQIQIVLSSLAISHSELANQRHSIMLLKSENETDLAIHRQELERNRELLNRLTQCQETHGFDAPETHRIGIIIGTSNDLLETYGNSISSSEAAFLEGIKRYYLLMSHHLAENQSIATGLVATMRLDLGIPGDLREATKKATENINEIRRKVDADLITAVEELAGHREAVD
jgi:hypothetical protein